MSAVTLSHLPSTFPCQPQVPRHIASSIGSVLVSSLSILCVFICTHSWLLMHTITPECCVVAGTVVMGVKFQLKAAGLRLQPSVPRTSQGGRPSIQLRSTCFSYFCHILEHSQKGLCLMSVMVWNGHGAVKTAVASHPGELSSQSVGCVCGDTKQPGSAFRQQTDYVHVSDSSEAGGGRVSHSWIKSNGNSRNS